MIFSLPPALIKTTEKVVHNEAKVSYSWGNVNALHKWIAAMDKKQVERTLGINGSKKYPLIWLVEGWKCTETRGDLVFKNVQFYISCNSDVSTLNENRVDNFGILYSVANQLIDKLKLVARIESDSVEFTERANFSVNTEAKASDVWDSLILDMNIIIRKSCTSKLYK